MHKLYAQEYVKQYIFCQEIHITELFCLKVRPYRIGSDLGYSKDLSCFDSSRKISWDQPIIDQPEIGFLGILCKEIKGSSQQSRNGMVSE